MKKTLILLFAISSFILPIYSEENVLQNTEITDAQNSLENEEIDLSDFKMQVAYSVCVSAEKMKADAIVCYTNLGNSARRLSGLGAGCPILAITDNKKTFRQLALSWNVYPVYVDTNAMSGRTGVYDELTQKWSNVIYMPCTADNNFAPESIAACA